MTNWLGRCVRVVDHLAVKYVAQGAPLGGGSTCRPGQKWWKTLFLLYYYLLRLFLFINL